MELLDDERLNGMCFEVSSVEARGEDDRSWSSYDISAIALHALDALQVAVLAIEQCVTGDKLMKSLDVANFYTSLGLCLSVENGDQGVLSDPGSVDALQDEIDESANLVKKARRLARSLRENQNVGKP